MPLTLEHPSARLYIAQVISTCHLFNVFPSPAMYTSVSMNASMSVWMLQCHVTVSVWMLQCHVTVSVWMLQCHAPVSVLTLEHDTESSIAAQLSISQAFQPIMYQCFPVPQTMDAPVLCSSVSMDAPVSGLTVQHDTGASIARLTFLQPTSNRCFPWSCWQLLSW